MSSRAAPVHPGRIIQCFDHFVIDLRGGGRVATYFTVYAVEYSPELGTGHVAFLRLLGEAADDDLHVTFSDAPEMARRMQARLLRMHAEVDMSRGSGPPAELEREPIRARFERLPWTEEGVGWRISPTYDSGTPEAGAIGRIDAEWRAGAGPVWVAAAAGTFTEGRDILGVMAGFEAASVRIDGREAPGRPYHDPWWEPRIGGPFSSCHVALAETSLTPAGNGWWASLGSDRD
jgi:hypothetical protein